MDITKTDVVQRVELLIDARLVLEKCECILDCEIENVSDRQSAKAHLECLAVVSLALAHVARDVDVGKKMHLDFHESIAFTCFAASALHVERKTTGTISANFCFGHFSEQLADWSEQSGVRRRIRSRCAPNR